MTLNQQSLRGNPEMGILELQQKNFSFWKSDQKVVNLLSGSMILWEKPHATKVALYLNSIIKLQALLIWLVKYQTMQQTLLDLWISLKHSLKNIVKKKMLWRHWWCTLLNRFTTKHFNPYTSMSLENLRETFCLLKNIFMLLL